MERKRYFRRFTLAFIAALACAAAWFALEQAGTRGLIDPALLGIGQIVSLVVLALFAARALVSLLIWLRRKNESLRMFDQGFTWTQGKDTYKSSWHKLVSFREGARALRIAGRPLVQWGAHKLTMHDGRVFEFSSAHGDPREFARAVRPYIAEVTGTRMGKALRAEKPVKLHPKLIVWPGGLEIDKLKIPWTELDVKVGGGRMTVFQLNKNGKFKPVHHYPVPRIDNISGFVELATSTMRNYQPERFGIKTQRALPKIEDIRYAPGIYKGTPMRSQGEIAFATELDARRIRWQYEAGALGRSKYVVDFYLPDYRCWVDIRKSRPNQRDTVILSSVADTIWRERSQERLFVILPDGALLINPEGMRNLTYDDFWVRLVRP
ncbi:MAG: hypothetical protein U0694_02400 [Anaerolineae bacterium]